VIILPLIVLRLPISYKSSQLLFVKDGSDKWIVGTQVLNDPNFAAIHDALNELERIEYTPFPPEPEL
jgi:hypothetical protein